uniref:Clade IX lectin receptor kinase n=1 Tax=Nicotiana benthamiana TaxID=4100 RepID=A0A0K1U1V3_NICBE|nr:clade IX lectin receptor kinase [Nicotiana benthamiana]
MNSISLVIIFFLIPFVHSIYFKIPRFGPDVTDILYEGDAVASVGEIEFNKFTYLCRVAHAIYKEKVPIWDPDSTKLADFFTHFSFTIDTLNRSLYGHGIAFFLAQVGFHIPPNSDGGFLGLFNTTTSDSAQNQIVVVEFDSFSNPEWDPPFEHVGINKNSIASSVTAPWNTLVILRKWRRRKMKRNPETISLTSFNDDLEKGTGPKKFSYEELDTSTNHFSEERKLGEGGFGEVYKGYLIDLDIAIAVKKISRGSKQGKKEYITEVKVISRLRHRNIVQLIGWCHDQEWEQCVIHRDIKSSNVMLDSSFNVKLGDFGLARLMDHELGPQTTGLAGTLGYLAPEYIKTGRASKESDVYSFGIVAQEIATGRKSVDPGTGKSDAVLVEYVWELYKGQLLSAVDEKLNLDFDAKQVERLMATRLWCAHPESNLRPSIRQAIHVLNFEASLPNIPIKMPVPVYDLPSSGEPGVSSGEPTITYTSIDVGR